MIIMCVARSSSGGLWNTKNVRMLARFRQLGHIPASLSRPVDHKSDAQLEMNMNQKTFTKHSMMQTCDQYQDTIRFTTQKNSRNSTHVILMSHSTKTWATTFSLASESQNVDPCHNHRIMHPAAPPKGALSVGSFWGMPWRRRRSFKNSTRGAWWYNGVLEIYKYIISNSNN